jgi:hypothetical protein
MAEPNFDKAAPYTEKMRLTQIVDKVISENYGVVNALVERVGDDNMNKDELAIALFSGLKIKIAEELAKDLNIENPSSREAWQKVMSDGKDGLIMSIVAEKAGEIGKKWNLFETEA